MAALPSPGRSVWVGPPFAASGPRSGSPLRKPAHDVSPHWMSNFGAVAHTGSLSEPSMTGGGKRAPLAMRTSGGIGGSGPELMVTVGRA